MRRVALASTGVAAAVVATLGAAPATAATTQGAANHHPPRCAVYSLPSFMDQGEGATASSIADVIQVECAPRFAEKTVSIYSPELYSACAGKLSWLEAPPKAPVTGSSTEVVLDDDGNAAAVLWGGPSCAAGTYAIFASLDTPSYPTAKTMFSVLPPRATPQGVSALPKTFVEDATLSSVVTIVQLEFPSYYGGSHATITSQQLFDRCLGSSWIGPDEKTLAKESPTATLSLDNEGNAFAVFIGVGCAAGRSTIEGSLDVAPYTSYTATYRILSPRITRH